MNKKKILFCDSSVNPQAKLGFGAYLLLDENDLLKQIDKSTIKTKLFNDTSSTKLELETLIWALHNIPKDVSHIEVFTDCQNIITLNSRREKLEKNDFRTSTNKIVKNTELYKEFYKLMDSYKIDFFKVKGHKKTKIKDEIDKIFTLVDRASRKKLREYYNSNSSSN